MFLKNSSAKGFLSFSALSLAIYSANIQLSNAAPAGGTISAGNGDANITTNGLTTTINQSSQNVTIDWDSFNVGSDEVVDFKQPNSASIAVNNIGGNSVSNIQGSITSNGQVFLSNPNGFLFSAGSSINTGSFLATTSSMVLSNGELELSNPSNDASIIFEENSSVVTNDSGNDNKNESFIAIFSPNISNSGSLSAQDSSIFLSTKNQGTIKLSGLDIGIDISNLTASNLEANLTGQTTGLSTENGSTNNYVLLSNSDLSTIIQSAIKSPSTMTEIKFSEHLVDYNIEVQGDNLGLAENTIIYNGGTERSLTFTDTSVEGLDILSSIEGSNLNLKLNAQNVTIGSDSSISLGGGDGGNGLKSITIDTSTNEDGSGSTIIYNGMKAIESINIDSELTYVGDGDSNEIVFSTVNSEGTISFTSAIKTNASDDTIILESNTLDLAGITGFDTVELYASTINLNASNIDDAAYIDANTISVIGGSELNLNADITLSASEIDISGVKVASSNYDGDIADENGHSLTLTSGSAAGQFKLNNLSDSENVDNSEDFTNIESLIIKGPTNSDTTSTVFISGDITTNHFTVNTLDSGSVEVTLTDNLTLNSVEEFNTQNASINGNYNLEINGAGSNNGSIANIGSISNSSSLTGFSAEGFSDLHLHDDIKVSTGDIALSATNIFINKSQTLLTDEALLIENSGNGTISLVGNTQTDSNASLTLSTFNGNITIGQVTDLDNLSIIKSLTTEGDISLQGNISVNNHIALNNLGDINLDNDIIFKGETFDSTATNLVNPLHDISIQTSTGTSLGGISAKDINISNENSSELDPYTSVKLWGDITATDALAFVGTSIELESDISLSGNINFLDQSTNLAYKPTINGFQNLYLNATNSDIYVYNFGSTTGLNSLTIEGVGNLFFTDMPTIEGSGGLSLLGALEFDVGDKRTFNYDGDIDFSGTTINGSGALTFISASGDISLGTIGNSSTIDSLTITSSGKLNLYGDITLANLTYDFSNLSAIQIYQDMTFGSAEAPSFVDFGSATIDGTYSLTIYSAQPTFGVIGSKIALQDLNIYSTGELNLLQDITLVGTANINADKILLSSNITSTGKNINLVAESGITMSSLASLNANNGNGNGNGNGNISLSSSSADISIGTLSAFDNVDINAQTGSIFNSINDYTSNTNTSINITSYNQNLYALNQIGSGVDSPIVIDAQNGGEITLESEGNIYIANISNAEVSSRSTVIDSGTANDSASVDAYSLFKLSSIDQASEPTLSTNAGLISNLTWQVDEEKSVKKIKTPVTVPPIYHSRKGWRLGH